MGGTKSKISDSPANVINEIETAPTGGNNNLILICIVIVLLCQWFTTLYQLHKKALKKNYLRSVADGLDKV